jgi:hypothetical protein
MKEEKKENYTAIFLMILVANILNKGWECGSSGRATA